MFVLLCSAGTVAQRTANDPWPDVAAHQSAFATVNGVRLHYLDWGGAGPSMVLVPGNGDSPHTFDGLAAHFATQYRIVAYARRGNGQSEKPATGYELDTFVEDLRGLMDWLGLARAVLVATSMGGAEMTRFAARYPQRVVKLVYLDAAYDWTDYAPVRKQRPQWPETAGVRKSFAAFREWSQRATPAIPWSGASEAALRDSVAIASDGSVTDVIPDSIAAAMVRVMDSAHREYGALQAPALAIFAWQSARTLTPTGAPEAFRRRMAEWVRDGRGPWVAKNIARFRREVKNGVVIELPDTDHGVYLHRETEVVTHMRKFLAAP